MVAEAASAASAVAAVSILRIKQSLVQRMELILFIHQIEASDFNLHT